MATVRAIIRTTKKTGTANVRFRISDSRNVQLWHVSEINVDVTLWDNSKERINTKKVCPIAYQREVDDKVNSRKSLLLSIYEAHKDSIKSSADLDKYVDDYLHPKTKEVCDMSFFEVFDMFLQKKDFPKSEWKNYKSLERSLSRYQSYRAAMLDKGFALSIGNVDKNLIEDYIDYCRNEYSLIQEDSDFFAPILEEYPLLSGVERKTAQVEKRGCNTIIKYKQRLKSFFNWLLKEGLILQDPFLNVEIGTPKYGTPYYITTVERDAIYEQNLSGDKRLEVQRDIFVFQCLIGCRVGDLLNLKQSNIVGDAVQYIPHKTKNKKPETITVPLHPKAKEILIKYHDKNPNAPLFPFLTAQRYNDAIKDIFTKCGITRMVNVIDAKTGEPKQMHLNEIASSHLARRTFVGNLYKKVKDPNLIGKLSGHSEGSRAFARYRDIDEDMKKELINML